MTTLNQNGLNNDKLKNYDFLSQMYADSYFPNHLVDQIKSILLKLCFDIEVKQVKNLNELYKLTHAATDKINDLQEVFYDSGSEIETGAREAIAKDFDYIAKSYGFDADIEELIATREW